MTNNAFAQRTAMRTQDGNAKDTQWHLALLGGLARGERWQMHRRTVAIAAVGGVDLDLTQTAVPDEGATLVKVSLLGGLKLTVPADVDVQVRGFSLIGRRRVEGENAAPGARVVRVHAYGIIGGVKVRRAFA